MVSYPNVVQFNPSKAVVSAEDIEDWVVDYLASLLEISPDELDPTISFDHYGLDSSAAVGLTGELEDWLNLEIEPTLLYDYPTVVALAEYLSLQKVS